jgi:hypothetical protein
MKIHEVRFKLNQEQKDDMDKNCSKIGMKPNAYCKYLLLKDNQNAK